MVILRPKQFNMPDDKKDITQKHSIDQLVNNLNQLSSEMSQTSETESTHKLPAKPAHKNPS